MFYDTLKELCDKKHTTPSAVCVALKISKSNVTEWKKGRWPRMDTVLAIAKHLSIEPAKLIPKDTDTADQEVVRNLDHENVPQNGETVRRGSEL